MDRKSFEEQIAGLPDDIRDRVLERAAILWEAGVAEDEADWRAYEMETGRSYPGLARARERQAAGPARRTGSSGTE
jgi:hypothetical protein